MTDLLEGLNTDQRAAVLKAVEWYRGFRDRTHRKRIHFLSGYAGTGKTHCANIIAKLCVGNADRVQYIAPTGKAASRLRQKGCLNAKTMHQFIYRVVGTTLDEEEQPIFVAKESLDDKPLLIVLDEACMVGGWDVDNLMALNIPILALGDVGQVRPVGQTPYFTKEKMDSLLEKIERQGAESNIIRASFFIRNGGRLPPREYDDVKVRIGRPKMADIKAHCGEDAVMICAYNSTRQRLNALARAAMGFSAITPVIGEKVVCTFNQHETGVMNGEQGIVLGYEPLSVDEGNKEENEGLMWLRIKSLTYGTEQKVFFNPLCFTEEDEDIKKMYYKKKGGYDFGWALTIHKSQGSEWDNVLVMEETLPNSPYAELMYTAVTRAAKTLLFFRRD